MNIKILVVLCAFMSACSYQNKGDHSSEITQDDVDAPNRVHGDSKNLSKSNLSDVRALSQSVICLDQNVNDWYGFNTKELDEATCNQISSYSIKEYQCAVSGKAFGTDMDAMNIQTEGASVFAYRSLVQCNEAKDIFDSNAP